MACGTVESDRDFFEGAALYLAGRSLWQVRQEQNSFRRLVVRQPLPGKLHQLLLANLLTFAEGNKRDNLFSVDGMRLANNSSLDHGRMLVESLPGSPNNRQNSWRCVRPFRRSRSEERRVG